MNILNNLNKDLTSVLNKFNLSENIDLKISNIEEFDFQINNLVKHQQHIDINEIKKQFEEKLSNCDEIFNYEITKSLFINIELNLDLILNEFENVNEIIKIDKKQKIIIDYGGPNIGKPLHVGHLRSLNIGRSLYSINKAAGNQIVSDIHLGDWGMPIAQILTFCEENDIQILSPQRRGDTGVNNLNRIIQEKFNNDSELLFQKKSNDQTVNFYLDDKRVIYELIVKALTKDSINLIDDGSSQRQYLFIDDAISMMEDIAFNLLDKKTTKNGPWNICNPSKISILELAELIGGLLDKPVIIGPKNKNPLHALSKVEIIPKRYQQTFGEYKYTDLTHGIKKVINSAEEQLNLYK